MRAVWRLFANGTVIPPEHVSERPFVSSVVTLFGGFGHFFFVISMSAAIELALLPEWPDHVGGPLVFFFGLALPCGELALVGDGVSDKARSLRRVPFC
jgi:hypothetical protein